jgi:ADP-heptose:LPS heptosyltransferase
MDIKNRNLFRITRFILLNLPQLLRFFARFRKPGKRLLLIKTDAIGDYVLFRNFIEITKRSEKYKGYRIDLLGNTIWSDVVETYDKGFLNASYFITPRSLYEAPFKTFKLALRLFFNNYEVVLQSTYTRIFITDGLAALTAAKHIIGYQGNFEGIEPRHKEKTDAFYTQMLALPPAVYFEFHRNRFFFVTVLQENIAINAQVIKTTGGVKNGIAILPGAGAFKRSWEKEKFLQLIKLIQQHSSHPICLIGGPAEVANGDYLMANLAEGGVQNFINKTSLPQLIEKIAGSALLIANETGAIHIAVAALTPSVCILGGGHFERFAPYPHDVTCSPVCVYEKLPCYYCNWGCIFNTAPAEPFPCISTISLEKVWEKVLPLLPHNSN